MAAGLDGGEEGRAGAGEGIEHGISGKGEEADEAIGELDGKGRGMAAMAGFALDVAP